jgi:GAF domain-containing protein
MDTTLDDEVADLRRANAELQRRLDKRTRERDEALAREAATAEVLQVINSSRGDLAPVFDAMLKKAMHLCDASFGLLTRVEGQNFSAVALCRVAPTLAEFLRQPQRIAPGQAHHSAMQGADVIHVEDITTEDLYRSGDPARRALADIGDARTGLCVALRKEGKLLGTIIVYRKEVRPFSDKQIALLQNCTEQALIAIENARLLTETREALEQQTATAEVLQVIDSSPGDLAPVFDAMLEKAIRLCEAASGSLWTYDGECFHAVAVRNVPPSLAEFVRQPHAAGPNTPLGRVMRTRQLVSIPDLAADEMYRSGDRWTAAPVELGGARSYLAIPLLKDDVIIGAFAVSRREIRPFTDKQIALLQNFAAQAVIAMENARLLGELRQRTADLEESLEYQTATSHVLKVISRSTFDLQPVLDTLVETAAHLCSADVAGMTIREGEGFRYRASYAVESEFYAFLRQHTFGPSRDTIVGRVALEGKVVHIADIAADPDYKLTESMTLGKIRTLLGVPLMRDGVVVGTFNLTRHQVDPFTERQIELVRTFADQAVIALENARLLDELRQRTNEVAELNRGLEARVAEQVEELGRVGRLKRFLAPQLAELIVSQGDEKILESHQREIVVVFCDLRGYTAFTETTEPEEALAFLREYHGALGPLVTQYEGTLDQFSRDGIMVFFNDPYRSPIRHNA